MKEKDPKPDTPTDDENRRAKIIAAIYEGNDEEVARLSKANQSVEFWKSVRQEAEAFWAKRYDPNATEDW